MSIFFFFWVEFKNFITEKLPRQNQESLIFMIKKTHKLVIGGLIFACLWPRKWTRNFFEVLSKNSVILFSN